MRRIGTVLTPTDRSHRRLAFNITASRVLSSTCQLRCTSLRVRERRNIEITNSLPASTDPPVEAVELHLQVTNRRSCPRLGCPPCTGLRPSVADDIGDWRMTAG
jgi:hypothetical protein